MDIVDKIIFKLLQLRGLGESRKSTLKKKEYKYLCLRVHDIFLKEKSLVEVSAPVNICGDIHGQYYDLIRIFEYAGYPPQKKYVFLGDYVDRGKHSLETIALLFAYKIKYPKQVILLRGNHECAAITHQYGFFNDCKEQFDVELWKHFIRVFNVLPIAAVVSGKIFCVHGGISPEMTSIEQVNGIRRPTDIPEIGLLADLMWCDPNPDVEAWDYPNSRGAGYTFGKQSVSRFLKNNGLDLLCRGHQVVRNGYEFKFGKKMVTLFSAPNYTGQYNNSGAIMTVNKNLLCSFTVLKPQGEFPVSGNGHHGHSH